MPLRTPIHGVCQNRRCARYAQTVGACSAAGEAAMKPRGPRQAPAQRQGREICGWRWRAIITAFPFDPPRTRRTRREDLSVSSVSSVDRYRPGWRGGRRDIGVLRAKPDFCELNGLPPCLPNGLPCDGFDFFDTLVLLPSDAMRIRTGRGARHRPRPAHRFGKAHTCDTPPVGATIRTAIPRMRRGRRTISMCRISTMSARSSRSTPRAYATTHARQSQLGRKVYHGGR